MSREVSTREGFREMALIEPVQKVLEDVGYENPTPIQAEIIPHMLAGKDVLGQAQTGTGKTAAFALPLLSKIKLDLTSPQVLVLAPTRELAIQVAEAFQHYAKFLKGLHVLPIYGGQDYKVQLRQLKRGVHVVVGTPGRVMDHMRRGTLKLDKLTCLTLDEADEMLRMGFIDDVEWILEQLPEQRQTALFSATMPPQIRRIAKKYLKNAEEVTIKMQKRTAETIRQRCWIVSGVHKLDALTRILEAETFDGMILFVRTKLETVNLAEKLEARGYSTAALNGDIAQNNRERIVQQFKTGKIDILVATDVAARGLDVDRVSHVINYDIPYDTEAYIHRIGRTGRAGRTGDAILFVAPREKRLMYAIEKATNQKIEMMELPSTEAINDKRIGRFKQQITETLTTDDLDFYRQLIESYQKDHDVPALEVAAALAKMVQGETPLLLKEQAHKGRRKDKEGGRTERNTRKDQRPRPRKDKPRSTGKVEEGMERFRLEVGHSHGVKPANIVGAIANEAGLDSQYIGRVDINDDFTLIDLPVGMPNDLFQDLKKVRVVGRPINISRDKQIKPSTKKRAKLKVRKRTKKMKGKRVRQSKK
ncbi:MAG TPA: DEAD/DEAH box helicase [Chromatiales bacterium]|nr:DEAD/DEAH box helicase [Thiotrichales bacterium]HIP67974.1 DEAD/DEAH box helicase [Chromatiales bacterium]